MSNLFEEVHREYTLFRNRDALSPHYIPSHLPYREDEIRLLSQKIAPILSGKKPENIFIYGKTGTGKTAVTKKVLNDLNEYAERKGLPVKGLYINGRMYDSEHKVIMRLVKMLVPSAELMGYSTSSIYDMLMEDVDRRERRLVVALDEIDMVKRVGDLIYRLNRANDELERGSISIIGISNNPLFKDRLDARTKSTLCEVELVFPPYNAEQLRTILKERVEEAFHKGVVEEDAISLAAAYAARNAGDARYALQVMLRAGDIAEEEGAKKVGREHVERARRLVEEDIVYEMISTLPEQHRLLIAALASMIVKGVGVETFGKGKVITSGMLYSNYKRLAQERGITPVSDRWFREYLNELETYGIIEVHVAGKGFRGNTRLIELIPDAKKIVSLMERGVI